MSTAYDSPAARHEVYRRSLAVVVCSQMLGGAGLAAGVTVGALLAQQMVGGAAVAGLPAALFTLGSALTAFGVGSLTQRSGRRPGLASGFMAGAIGAAGIVVAAVVDSPWLLFSSMFVYGAGTATNLQARYAGTDLAPARSRATAVSVAMVSTTFGAVAGPNLVGPLGHLARHLGIPALAGPFLLAAVAYGLAALVLFVFLRPDPFIVARGWAAVPIADIPSPAVEPQAPATHDSGVVVGATVMVLTQVAMVAIMTMTPVQMRHHDRSLGEVGFVISMHIAAMYLPSLVTGRLVDSVGRLPMAVASAVTLLAAGLVAGLSPGSSMPLLTLGLVLLGLGWNLGLISGTALVVDSTPVETRASTQGSVDVLIALSGAGGGALSGMVVGVSSYAVLSLSGGLLALLLIPVVSWHRSTSRAAVTAPSP